MSNQFWKKIFVLSVLMIEGIVLGFLLYPHRVLIAKWVSVPTMMMAYIVVLVGVLALCFGLMMSASMEHKLLQRAKSRISKSWKSAALAAAFSPYPFAGAYAVSGIITGNLHLTPLNALVSFFYAVGFSVFFYTALEGYLNGKELTISVVSMSMVAIAFAVIIIQVDDQDTFQYPKYAIEAGQQPILIFEVTAKDFPVWRWDTLELTDTTEAPKKSDGKYVLQVGRQYRIIAASGELVFNLAPDGMRTIVDGSVKKHGWEHPFVKINTTPLGC